MLRVPLLATLACLLACSGGTADTGSSWGERETNTRVTATLDAGTYEAPACSGADLTASAALAADTIDPDLPANALTLDSYAVLYGSVGASSPALSAASYAMSSTLPAASLAVVLVDADRIAEAGAGASYTATVTFAGHDAYGSDWGASASALVTLGTDGECALAISPGSIAVTALANPDGDASDDLTFHLSGGSPPYTVYSDSADALVAPGPLGEGVSSFTVDPDAVAATTIVTLTAVDAAGAAAEAEVVLAAVSGVGVSALSVSPAAISLSAYANPDGDTSDDVTFTVLGGAPPYAVYSSDAGVLDSPGALGEGVASFTVDPAGVAVETDVTLTVLDAAGASATALVSVLPASATLALSPASLVLSAWPNPDDDTADDLTFRVSGGTPPYKVYSDDTDVIDLTGYEVGEAGTFVVDPNPDPMDGTVEVTLTVVDAAQGAATARVTIVPGATGP